MRDRGARTAASVADLAEEAEVADPDGLGDLDLVGLLHGVGGERVDLGRRDARVVEGGEDRPAGQRLLAVRELLGEGVCPIPTML